jgi:hypothetical protein
VVVELEKNHSDLANLPDLIRAINDDISSGPLKNRKSKVKKKRK